MSQNFVEVRGRRVDLHVRGAAASHFRPGAQLQPEPRFVVGTWNGEDRRLVDIGLGLPMWELICAESKKFIARENPWNWPDDGRKE